jgi:hypothetical protein
MRLSSQTTFDLPKMEGDSLFNAAPVAQVVVGALLFVGGAVATVVLWLDGYIDAAALTMVVIGPLVALNGFSALRHKRALDAQLRLLSEQGEEILAAVIEAKQSGGRAVRLLREKGIEDTRLRQAILREVNQRIAKANEAAEPAQ